MIRTRCLLLALVLLGIVQTGQAQTRPSKPWTLDQIVRMIQGGLTTPEVLNYVRAECISFPIGPETEARLRSAGGTPELITGLRSTCVRTEDTPPPAGSQPTPETRPPGAPPTAGAQRFSPGAAAVRSLLVPGLGQFSTRRPVQGIAFLGAAGGMLAWGLLSDRVEILCAAPAPDNNCSSDDEITRGSSRPYLAAGIGGVVALGLLSGLDAYLAAKRANTRPATTADMSYTPTSGRVRLALPAVQPAELGGMRVELIRFQF